MRIQAFKSPPCLGGVAEATVSSPEQGEQSAPKAQIQPDVCLKRHPWAPTRRVWQANLVQERERGREMGKKKEKKEAGREKGQERRGNRGKGGREKRGHRQKGKQETEDGEGHDSLIYI